MNDQTRKFQISASCAVRIDGQEIRHAVSSVRLDQFIDRHHVLKIRLLHVAQASSSSDFADPSPFAGYLGKTIGVTIAPQGTVVASSQEMQFVGIVTQVDIENSIEALNSVLITATSPTIVMDAATRDAFFYEQKASDIVAAILQKHSITLGSNTATNGTLKFCVQYGETDYQFVRRLAGANGLFAFYDGQRFSTAKATGSSPQELAWRQSLGAFSLGLGTASFQYEGTTWDYIRKNPIASQPNASAPSLSGVLKKSVDASKQVFTKASTSPIQPLAPDARTLDQVMDARKGAALGRMIVCDGVSVVPAVAVGKCVRISGMGSAIDGTYWVNEVSHSFDESGQYSNSFRATPVDMANPYHSPTLPPVTQVQTAVVTDNNDPDGLGRVKVKFPWMDQNETPFVRIAMPDAGKERGWFLMPEVGDEVLVAYEQGNPDCPIVIGCLYNGVDKPAVAGGAFLDGSAVMIKEFKTRNGNIIRFTDKDGDEQLEILQKDGKNAITMKVNGPSIMIESKDGDITIKGKNLVLDGQSINLKSQQDIGLKSGTDMKIEAGANMTQKATANLEMQASAQVSVKGAIIQLN
jgi:type VI secretion system secreted protein VgrG